MRAVDATHLENLDEEHESLPVAWREPEVPPPNLLHDLPVLADRRDGPEVPVREVEEDVDVLGVLDS